MNEYSYIETVYTCPNCGAFYSSDWDSCKTCGFNFYLPHYNYELVKPKLNNFIKILSEMDSVVNEGETKKWPVTEYIKSNYDISLVQTLKIDFLDYLSYLSGGDNYIDDREVFFINSFLDTTFITSDIIEIFHNVGEDIKNKLPLSFYWLYEYELSNSKRKEKPKKEIDPNDFYSVIGVNNEEEKIECTFDLVTQLYELYESLGKLFILCGGEATSNETFLLNAYLDSINFKLKLFRDIRIKAIIEHANDEGLLDVDYKLIIRNIENEYGLVKKDMIKTNDHVSFEDRGHNFESDNINNLFDELNEFKTLDDYIEELNKLIGLESVKSDVNSLINLIQVRQVREQRGMKQPPMSLHLVFSGNPGTGKTTVARLLSKIYHEMGLLSKGHLIETDRSGLVGGYVGQTAIKTQEVIQSAMGGILFIDEAYTLSSSKGESDYGQESIDTILKAMEDNRDDLIVIVAGYPDLMKEFLQSNPGLQSRFNKFISFEDYNPEELYGIFKLMCDENNLILDDKADEFVKTYFVDIYNNRGDNFANGREVRNLFENVLTSQANRISSNLNVSDEELNTLKYEDFN